MLAVSNFQTKIPIYIYCESYKINLRPIKKKNMFAEYK